MVFVEFGAKIPLCHTIVKGISDQWHKTFHERRKFSGKLFSAAKAVVDPPKHVFSCFLFP